MSSFEEHVAHSAAEIDGSGSPAEQFESAQKEQRQQKIDEAKEMLANILNGIPHGDWRGMAAANAIVGLFEIMQRK